MKYAVYYRKASRFEVDPNISVTTLNETHTKVRELEADSLAEVFELHGDNWEGDSIIEELGLQYKFMSAGDVIVTLTKQGVEVRYYQVTTRGFSEFE